MGWKDKAISFFQNNRSVVAGAPIIPPRWSPFTAHTYQDTRQPSPGTMRLSYTNLGLAEQTFIGAGVAVRQFIRPLQQAQIYQFQAQLATGVGGLAAGQMILQPLVNPNSPYLDGFPGAGG